MCGGGSAPKPQAQLPEAPRMPDPKASLSETANNKKKRATAGGTILTSAQGVTEPGATSQKTLLGA